MSSNTPFRIDLIATKLARLERIEKLIRASDPIEGADIKLMLVRSNSQAALLRVAKALVDVRLHAGHVAGCVCAICEEADAALIALQANDE